MAGLLFRSAQVYILGIYIEAGSPKMQTVVKKWGNSLALRLPQTMAADLKLEEGAAVSMTLEDHALVVRPVRKRYRLQDLLDMTPSEAKRGEANWGEAKGGEEW